CRLAHKPVVWSPRGMLQRWHGTNRPHLKSVWEKVCQLVSPAQLLLHTTSEEEAEGSQRRLPGLRTVVIPNGVDIPDSVSCSDRDKEFRLVYLGRLHPQKGIENLLYAYKMVHHNLEIRSSLIIAGTGEKQYIQTLKLLIRQLGLSGQVTM